mmetsp:Transcript_89223/g.252825  ORF Transcript_89223/g.252825 Transcript_89223/m.252825 type:complete len:215 (-) Transcript_89223:181-825(-)
MEPSFRRTVGLFGGVVALITLVLATSSFASHLPDEFVFGSSLASWITCACSPSLSGPFSRSSSCSSCSSCFSCPSCSSCSAFWRCLLSLAASSLHASVDDRRGLVPMSWTLLLPVAAFSFCSDKRLRRTGSSFVVFSADEPTLSTALCPETSLFRCCAIRLSRTGSRLLVFSAAEPISLTSVWPLAAFSCCSLRRLARTGSSPAEPSVCALPNT